MRVLPISLTGNSRFSLRADNKSHSKTFCATSPDSISFQRLLPKNAKIKIAFFDIDETLKHWDDKLPEDAAQKIRNKLFDYVKSNKITSVYSSDRGLDKIIPLIEDGILAQPDWIVGNNGGFIYKNNNGKFEEIKSWSDNLLKNFNKEKIRGILVKIANEKGNKFSQKEWSKIPLELIPDGQKEFRGSKISEYVGNESPINLRLVLAPKMYEKNIQKIEKEFKNNNVKAGFLLFHYPKEMGSYECLRKYFDHKKTTDMINHYRPRLYPDSSYDVLLVSASDKGMASEYIRKNLGLKRSEVFAAGDGENDFSNANKKYHFALISNAVEGLKKMLNQTQKINIIEVTKPGAEGILEAFV